MLNRALFIAAAFLVSGSGCSRHALSAPRTGEAGTARVETAPYVALTPGTVSGVRALPASQLVYGDGVVRDRQAPRFNDPVRLLLSRHAYPAEDGHLDAMVWLTPAAGRNEPTGHLQVTLLDTAGRRLSEDRITVVHPSGIFFSVGLPPSLAGSGGRLRVTWLDGAANRGQAEQAFEVRPPANIAQTGRISLSIPNDVNATLRHAPMTVGVPFPRGALHDPRNLRLLDEGEREIPLQVRETARWSRFGPVKWALLDFTLDLVGAPRTLQLEYGPGVARAERAPLSVAAGVGLPTVDAGRLRLDAEGLWCDLAGTGRYRHVLAAPALNGAFVEHEDGRVYRVPARDPCEVEESGSEKVVIRREGWYRDTAGERQFCRYITRFIVHRDSTVLRLVHTWIFTGDGNRDRIANMGWTFALGAGLRPAGFLTGFDQDSAWHPGRYLLQFDHDRGEIATTQGVAPLPGGRAAGAARAEGDGLCLYFGTKDFWQNYPSELEFRDGALCFHNWPRHGRPFDREQSTRDILAGRDHFLKLKFAHAGEALDFRLPDGIAASEGIWRQISGGREDHWRLGEPESVNAQGISRTEEMWLYVTDGETEAKPVLQGLNAERLRAVVDPAWIAASGAFYEIHPRDRENFPEDERIFEQVALAPGRWTERLELYGMWIFGDSMWGPRLDIARPSLYRAFRKSHQGWPYSWVPYARSGDPRLLKLAAAATRQMIDANYCHYVSADVAASVGNGKYRRLGRWWRGALPWAGMWGPTVRHYHDKCDFLWHAWYLTGCYRALDHVRDWAAQTQHPEAGAVSVGDRPSQTLIKSYLEMYEGTFDPWFLIAAHALGEGQLHTYRTARNRGHLWTSGDREFLRFTGNPEYHDYFLAYADTYGNHDRACRPGSWALLTTTIEPNAYAWILTGKDYYLRRVADELDRAKTAVYDGDPAYFRGYLCLDRTGNDSDVPGFTSWYLQYFPAALAALHRAGNRPTPVYRSFVQRAAQVDGPAEGVYGYSSPTVALRKVAGEALALNLAVSGDSYRYVVTGPDGKPVLTAEKQTAEQKVTVPADAPPGVYRLRVQIASKVPPQKFNTGIKLPGLELPVSTVDAPEIIELEPGEAMGRGVWHSQYWFKVPEGVRRFVVEIPVEPDFLRARRLSIWGPDGERVWNRQFVTGTSKPRSPRGIYRGENPIRAEIEVRPDQADRLWRITLPGRNGGFRMDPQIPPIYSVNPNRWFSPGTPPVPPAAK